MGTKYIIAQVNGLDVDGHLSINNSIQNLSPIIQQYQRFLLISLTYGANTEMLHCFDEITALHYACKYG